MKAKLIILTLVLTTRVLSQTPQLQYEKSTNYLGSSSDITVSGAIDAIGNSWHIGYTQRQLSGIDWYIVKLNNSGDTLWTRLYNGPNNGTDRPVGIYVDVNGVSYIVGTVETQNNALDIVVISYTSNGSFNWQFRYNFDIYAQLNSRYNTADEIPIGIKEDSKSQLVVVGYGNPKQDTKDAEILFFTMDKNNGKIIDEEIIWGGEYWENGFWKYYEDIPTSFDVVNDRVFIASEKRSEKTNYWSIWAIYRYKTGDYWNSINNDMGSMNGGTLGYIDYFVYPSGYFYSGKDYNYPTAITGDASGNTYVSGIIDTISNTGVYNKISTIRIPQNNMALTWENKYDNGNGNLKYINDFKIDYGNGVNYLTGWVTNNSNNKDIITIKYSNSGTHYWSKLKNWNGNDEGVDLEIDKNDNPIICSNVNTGNSNGDIGIVKYNKDNGNETSVLYSKNTEDEIANAIQIDKYNNVYIFGQNKHNSQNNNLLNLKYCNYFPVTSISSSTSICEGMSTQLNSSGGTIYSWSPNYNLSNRNIKNPVASPKITTKYYVQIKEDYGCFTTDSVSIVVKPKPMKPLLSSNSPVCYSDKLKLTAFSNINNVDFEWIGPRGFNSKIQYPIIEPAVFDDSGYYFGRILLNGCYSDTSNTLVLVKELPKSPVLKNNTPICLNKTLELSADFIEGAEYEWSGINSFFSGLQNPIIANVSIKDSGTYACKIKKNSCYSNSSVTIADISNKPKARLIVPIDKGCFGDSLLIEVTLGDYYKWSNGIEGETFHQIKLGSSQNVYCEVTNPNTCIGIARTPSKVISIYSPPNKPKITIQGENIICTNASSYQWFLNGNLINNATSQIYKPVLSGKYLVKIIDQNGCESFSNELQFFMLSILDFNNDLKIYPNPTKTNLKVFGIDKMLDFEIVDMQGKLLYKGRTESSIDISHLLSGIYFLRINDLVFKLIKE